MLHQGNSPETWRPVACEGERVQSLLEKAWRFPVSNIKVVKYRKQHSIKHFLTQYLALTYTLTIALVTMVM